MKSFLILFTIFLNGILVAQYGDLSFQYRYGISTSNMKRMTIEQNPFAYEECKTLNDQGLMFLYSYPILKRLKVHIHAGFDISETKRYLPLIDPVYSRQLSNINMNNNRVAYRFGVSKSFHFYDSKVQIELGFTMVKRNYLKNNILIIQDYQRKENAPWIEHKYVVTSKYDEEHKSGLPLYKKKLINKELSLSIKFQLINKLTMILNFSFSGNYYVLYDLESEFRYYIGGDTSPTYTWHSHGPLYSEGIFYSKRDHFLYTGIGLNYNLDFKKKKIEKL